MDVRAIIHELTQAEGLPKEALKAASAQRVEMVPLFIKEIEDHLALEPVARLLKLPGREVDAIFGDGITTTSHRVMAGLFDGDPQPLYDIILDPNADEYLRASMIEALAMVTLRGELDRDLAGRFLRDIFMEMQPQAECYAWVGWQSAIAMLGLSDLKILVKKAFDRGFIDSHVLGFDDFEQDLKRGIECPDEPRRPDDHEYTLFGDTIEELSGWYCFTEQYSEDQERWRRQAEANRARSQR